MWWISSTLFILEVFAVSAFDIESFRTKCKSNQSIKFFEAGEFFMKNGTICTDFEISSYELHNVTELVSDKFVLFENCKLNSFNDDFVSKIGKVEFFSLENCKVTLKDSGDKTMLPLESMFFQSTDIKNVMSTSFKNFNNLNGFCCLGCSFDSPIELDKFLPKESSLDYINISHSNVTIIGETNMNITLLDLTAIGLKKSLHFKSEKLGSLILAHNEIEDFPKILTYSMYFNIMNLSNNKFKDFQITKNIPNFSNLRNLRSLDLSENQGIVYLEKGIFTNFTQLISLNMSGCGLTKLEAIDARALVTLDLSRNSIKNIPSDAFANQNELKVLSLQMNEIQFLNASLFDNLKHLKTLDLSANRLRFLDINKLEQLSILDASDNMLESIEVLHLTKLRKLKLQNNKLTKIHISQMHNLEELNLRNNNLTIVLSDVSKSLVTLDVSSNKEIIVNMNTLKRFQDLISSNISNTNIKYDINGVLKTYKPINVSSFETKTPSHYTNFTLSKLDFIYLVFSGNQSLSNYESIHFENSTFENFEAAFCEKFSKASKLSIENSTVLFSQELHNRNAALESLKIENSKIMNFQETNMLNNFRDLKEFTIVSCDLDDSELKEHFFTSNKLLNLTILNSGLTKMLVTEFEELEILNLSGNKLNKFPVSSLESSSLKALIIADNNITNITIGSLTLHNLEILNISNNLLEYLDMENITERFASLKHLNASHNNLTLYSEGTMFPSELILLDLSSNKIKHFIVTDNNEDGSEEYKLEFLDLSHNLIEYMDPESFQRFPKLAHLNIGFNKLQVLNHEYFPKNAVLHFWNLEHNALSNISETALNELVEIESLDISFNHFNQLPIINQLSSLKRLYVVNNNFTVPCRNQLPVNLEYMKFSETLDYHFKPDDNIDPCSGTSKFFVSSILLIVMILISNF